MTIFVKVTLPHLPMTLEFTSIQQALGFTEEVIERGNHAILEVRDSTVRLEILGPDLHHDCLYRSWEELQEQNPELPIEDLKKGSDVQLDGLLFCAYET